MGARAASRRRGERSRRTAAGRSRLHPRVRERRPTAAAWRADRVRTVAAARASADPRSGRRRIARGARTRPGPARPGPLPGIEELVDGHHWKAWRVLPHRDFRNLLPRAGASTIGDRLVFVALALYVTEIGSPTDVGLVLAAQRCRSSASCCSAACGPTGCRGTRVMIASDLVRFALHALLAVLILTRTAEVWHIVVIEALYGCAEAFFRAGPDRPDAADGARGARSRRPRPRAGRSRRRRVHRAGAGHRARGRPGRRLRRSRSTR